MTVKEFLDRFVFVYKCVSCDEILSYEQSKSAFCPKCRTAWEKAKTVSCPTCYREAVACTCMPKPLAKEGALCLRKLMFYDKAKENEPPNRLIYRLKHGKNFRFEHFVANELARQIREELCVLSLDGSMDEVLLTYLPRSRRAVRDEGFDQSERMARAVGAVLGISVEKMILRTHFSRIQKALNARERMRNAKQSFFLSPDAGVQGKYVILIDDIVTTGAGMSVCAALLRKAGARGILCFCIAMG